MMVTRFYLLMDSQTAKITIGPGWQPILELALEYLAVFDRLQQLDGLGEVVLKVIDGQRGFFHMEYENIHPPYDNMMYRLAGTFRGQSSKMCEICGERSARRKYFSWVPTLCRKHFIESANYADDRKRAILAGEWTSVLGLSPRQ